MEREGEREMKHFSHFHPLAFNKECEFEGTTCYGCLREISGPLYGCNRCQLFLHKFCAEAPREMTHHFHPQHQLYLNPRPGYSCVCDICREEWRGFTYCCRTCYFDIDMKCASAVLKIQQPIQHPSHEHKLIPLEKPFNHLCEACNTKHEGSFYLCTECGFWVHQGCADSLPTTIEPTPHNRHPHPLTLVYSIPPHKGSPNCKICFKTLTRNQWAYSCSKCNHVFHLSCLASEIQYYRDQKAKTEAKKIDPNLLYLPWANESVDLTAQLIKNLVLEGKRKDNGAGDQEQPNIIHDHELINFSNLKTDQHSETSCSSAADAAAVSKQSEIGQCNGCGETILEGSSYLRCAKPECNFFIHDYCAELPSKLEHPCHPQQPILLITQESPNFCPRYCYCCQILCNTFFYGCVDCRFYIDVKCASLPIGVRHASHQHTLALRRSQGCSLCGTYLGCWVFVCETCDYKVCTQCALLPASIRHRYDKHPFTLTHPSSNVKDKAPAGDHKDRHEEDYCEICEEGIDFKRCFYHCHGCDQFLHVKCFYPNFNDEYSNIKYGINFRAKYHPHHPLTCVRSPKDGKSCSHCETSMDDDVDGPLAFECADCKFWVHDYCGGELFYKTK